MNRRIDEIPVSDRLDAAVANGMQQVHFIHRKQIIKRSIAMAASFAILIGGFFIWGFSNPVLASQIPIIGRIFMENEEKISFPGNYSEKADVLDTTTKVPVIITPDTTEAPSTEEDATEPVVEMVSAYSTHDAGYQITANEVYCDGSSIYLAMTVTADNRFGYMYGVNRETFENEYMQTLNFAMIELTLFDGEESTVYYLDNSDIEGTQTALDSYEGILKLNLGDTILTTDKNYTATLDFYSMYYSAEGSPDIYPGISGVVGDWRISSIPFTVDSESVREFAINDRNEQGFGVGKIIITPFEVKIEYFRSSPDADYGTSVFDANGNRLLFHEEISSEETGGLLATYPVSDADISTLHIYIGEDGIECIKETDQNAMANRAVYSYTLDTTTEK